LSESYEPSYYEIALTNRQVVVAFVILLICLMGTFFAGVWVGRGEVQAAAPATPQQRSAGDEGIEPLDFFGGGDEPAADAGGAAAGEPAAQQPDARPRREPPTADASGGEGAALPSTDAALPPSGADAAPRQPEPQTATPRSAAAQRPAAPQPRSVPAAGAPVEGPVVQVFSSADREQAQKVRDRLVDGGQPAYLSPVEVEGRTMYRVRIGPFRDRGEAEKVADAVRHQYKYDTWITQ
jgi:cell division septation protein DedD